MSEAHQTLDLEHVRRDLHDLHDHVIHHWGRIEIIRDGDGGRACVLLSKAELDCIEQALEILHEAPSGKSMVDEILKIVEGCSPPCAKNKSTLANSPADQSDDVATK